LAGWTALAPVGSSGVSKVVVTTALPLYPHRTLVLGTSSAPWECVSVYVVRKANASAFTRESQAGRRVLVSVWLKDHNDGEGAGMDMARSNAPTSQPQKARAAHRRNHSVCIDLSTTLEDDFRKPRNSGIGVA
jgi:hypothetical protein